MNKSSPNLNSLLSGILVISIVGPTVSGSSLLQPTKVKSDVIKNKRLICLKNFIIKYFWNVLKSKILVNILIKNPKPKRFGIYKKTMNLLMLVIVTNKNLYKLLILVTVYI